MREGDYKIFYTPVVYNPETQSSEPLADGGTADAFLGVYGWSNHQHITRESLKPTMVEPSNPMPLVVLDPMSIPIATFATNIKDDNGLQNEDTRQGNMLKIIPNSGLIVEPYRDILGKTVESNTYNRIVTLANLRALFNDCNHQPLEFPDENAPFKTIDIATCANLEAMKQEIRSLISEVRQTLVDMQNQLQQEIDSKFDGSNATPDIKDDLDNAGTSSTSDYEPKPMRVLAAECRHGRDSDVTRYYAVAAGLTPDTTYAIDQYIANPLRAEPSYLGTHYVQSNSSGQVSRHVRMYHGGNFGDEPRFVLRTLRADESHRQGQGAPYQGQCQF